MARLWSSVEVVDLTGDDEDELHKPQPAPVPARKPLRSPVHSDKVKAPSQNDKVRAALDLFNRFSPEGQSYMKAELEKRAGTKQDSHARQSLPNPLSTAPYTPKERDEVDKTASTDGNPLTRRQRMAMGRVERDRNGRFATGDGLRKASSEEGIEQSTVPAFRAFQNGTSSTAENAIPNGRTKAGPFDLSQSRSTKSLKRMGDSEFKYDITERSVPAALPLAEIQHRNQHDTLSNQRIFKETRSPIPDNASFKRAKLLHQGQTPQEKATGSPESTMSNRKPCVSRARFTPDDDRRIVDLKENKRWSWDMIVQEFPGRTKGVLQTRYCKYLTPAKGMRQTECKSECSSEAFPPKSVAKYPFSHVSPRQSVSPSRQERSADSSVSVYSHGEEDREPALSPPAVLPRQPEAKLPGPRNIKRAESLSSMSISNERARKIRNDMHRKHARRRTTKHYLGMPERSLLRSSLLAGEWDNQALACWEGTVLHSDFDADEKHAIWDSVRSVLGMRMTPADQSSGVPWDQVMSHLDSIVSRALSKRSLQGRTRRCIERFLKNLSSDPPTATRSHKQLIIKHIDPRQKKTLEVGHFLRSRELGMSRRSRNDISTLGTPVELQNRVYDTMGPSLTFTGTSGDVGTVAWSPDGSHFAAGSIALMDSSSMQYNQPNNLLLGNFARNSLRELPNHKIERKKPIKGINATDAMHRSQDPVIFTTVSMVKFSPDNHFMYSTGYDHTLKAWDIRPGPKKYSCLWSFPHEGVIDLLSVGESGIVATGSQRTAKNSIKVFKCDQDGNGAIAVHGFHSVKAVEKPDAKTFPSSLALGSRWSKSRLLAGFSSNVGGEAGNYISGETCIWNIETGQQIAVYKNTRNVFDCVWHPNNVTFGVGSLAGGGVNRGTRSVVRLYDPNMDGRKYMDKFELECPAYDMNDIVFCPYDDNIVSASCTSGRSFIWDIRNPDEILHTLTHGDPLIELPGQDIREKEDTGVRFTSFGHSRNRFYTGSSDGVVKSWDIYRSPEDVWVRDVTSCKSGIMSGAFSPDFSNLILGEVNGTINLLSVGREDMSIKDAEPFQLERAANTTSSVPASKENDESTLGIRTANAFLASGEIVLRPLGDLPFRQAVQGPNYSGPFNRDPVEAALLRAQAATFQEKFQITFEPCTVDHSADYAKITEEERGDSGRSRDRIPHALRWPLREENSKGKTAKCAQCGLPAHTSGKEQSYCERCRFTCFRCGKDADTLMWKHQVDIIGCGHCRGTWRIDCLGFTPLDRRTGAEMVVSFPSADREGEGEGRRLEEEEDVEWYYHSMWGTSS